MALVATTSFLSAAYVPRRTGNFDFPVYTNRPAGRQLSGAHAPATTQALSPEETRRKIAVPPGFEVRLFASEPEVVNPVAMTWDSRGRLWVLELYEYPKGTPRGQPGRDRIKILEDTDNDGVADKVTVFAEGFSLAEGFILGNGGVYVAASPNLYFLRDTNHDDRADTREVVLTGLGNEDRHELMNGFAWGPDGWLYLTHGVFTRSQIKDPNNPDDGGVRMDAAVARFDPKSKRIEVFADGTSNPWGVDWNERGDAFVEACVIHHLFHMAPGGLYNRQGGTWANSFGYVQDLPTKGLPAIVNWRHFRAAHSGICIYQGDQWPAEWRGLVYFGNIHENSINCDRLTAVGATYSAEPETRLLGPRKGDFTMGGGTFFASADPWVMPVSIQTGPDGAIWVMDWYDRYPCYQNAQADPEGVDRELGRIWRVVWTGDQPGRAVPSRPWKNMDLASKEFRLDDGSTRAVDLLTLLNHRNSWVSRQASRLIAEGLGSNITRESVERFLFAPANEAPNVAAENRLTFFWALHVRGLLDDALLDRCSRDDQASLRGAAARAMGERGDAGPHGLKRLASLAADAEPSVRAAAAVALRQFTSGSLTVDTPPRVRIADADLIPMVATLLARPSAPGDFYYPHILWMAMEPRVAANPKPFLDLLAKNDGAAAAYCAPRVMRRICDLADGAVRERYLNEALQWLAGIASRTELASAALDGLIEAEKSKGAPPTIDVRPIFEKLTANPDLAGKSRRLATMLGDTSASRSLIAKINDPGAPLDERLKGIEAAGETRDAGSRAEILRLMTGERNQALLLEGAKALPAFSGDEIAYQIVDAWKGYSLPVRRAVSEVLVTRSKWARALLAGVDNRAVKPEDISAVARRALARSEDTTIGDHADRVLGRYRATGADKLKVIGEKRKMVLSGTPDLNNGHEVAKRTCFVCHKLHGEGADVGPDLTGVGRSSLDALLHNIIDPNEVIGAGYETTEVELKDDTTVSGRVVEETETRIKLLASGPTEHTLARSDIKIVNGKPAIRKTELSLMPEGLEQMPDNDFRDLVWYILNPPQDNRPWTPALRKELLGDDPATKRTADSRPNADEFRGKGVPAGDGESVALWNPEWRVTCPPFEGAPKKLVEFAGRRNVLMTHPVSRTTPSTLERVIEVPRGRRTTVSFLVAADEKGDWELRVRAGPAELTRQIIDHAGDRWRKVAVDLTRFAGQTITLRLENAANDWNWEFGYWAELELRSDELAASAK